MGDFCPSRRPKPLENLDPSHQNSEPSYVPEVLYLTTTIAAEANDSVNSHFILFFDDEKFFQKSGRQNPASSRVLYW